jgi:hypothetical protein
MKSLSEMLVEFEEAMGNPGPRDAAQAAELARASFMAGFAAAMGNFGEGVTKIQYIALLHEAETWLKQNRDVEVRTA